MRFLFPAAVTLMVAASTLAARSPPAPNSALQAADCPAASAEWARQGRAWQHKPVTPQKLSQLPPADSYAAVYRLDERGCMVPVKFGQGRR